MSNAWFKMAADFAYNPKIQTMSEEMQRRLVMLYCLHCSGFLGNNETQCNVTSNVSCNNDHVSFALRVTKEALHETKKLFIELGFMDENWQLTNWQDEQKKTEKTAASTDRVRRYREKKKQEEEKKRNALHETLQETNETPLEQNRTEQNNVSYNNIIPTSTTARDGPIVDKSPVNYDQIVDLNNLFVCVEVVCNLFGRKKLTQKEQEAISDWCLIFDMKKVLPVIDSELQKFRKRSGKDPTSLLYFKPIIDKLPRVSVGAEMAKILGTKMRVS